MDKERPDDIEVEMAKIGDTLEDCDINDIMKNVCFPQILNPVGNMIMRTMSLAATDDTLKFTEVQQRRFNELSADITKLFVKYNVNYAEMICWFGNMFNHILQNNPESKPDQFRREKA